MLQVYELSRESLRTLKPVLERVQRHDRDLCRQMRRAGASVLLNIAEGARRMGRDSRQHFLIAAGSNAELRAALDVSEAFGYMQPEIYRELDSQLDSVAAMLYRLTH